MLTPKQIDGLNQARARHIIRTELKGANVQRYTTKKDMKGYARNGRKITQ